jgi:glutathione peroxidase
MSAIYDFKANSLAGEEVALRRFEGQVLLIVNTASKCGFTPQYRGLEDLHRDLSPRGFSVLGFPCNQFGAQEPGQASEIQAFCSTNYDVTFPLFEKIDVNGANAHPLYEYLKRQQSGLLRARWSRATRRPHGPKDCGIKSKHCCERDNHERRISGPPVG